MTPHTDRQNDLLRKVIDLKASLGRSCLILTHHYQRPEIVAVGDVRGDSLGLSRHAAESQAQNIVFCGVRFMAESAAVLAKPMQMVHHPDPFSGCPMADMADIEDVERAFGELDELLGPDGYVPVTYVNSTAEVKAATGIKGGACCTSGNAATVMKWALKTGKKVVFIPDENLGLNTAKSIGIPGDRIARWDFSRPLGGVDPAGLKSSDLVVWRGYCHVHTFFNTGHVSAARKAFPGARIVVHPECSPDVVEMADATGSTEFMVRFVREAGPGSITVVGTELNLVRRLAAEMTDRTVLELSRSFCPNMFKITLAKLLATLENLDGVERRVTVPESTRVYARAALEKMLELS
jgi:quinolinate synthase